jgi:hypothetical protein
VGELPLANNSLERTQPERDFMCDVEMLRRSARSRYAEFGSLARDSNRLLDVKARARLLGPLELLPGMALARRRPSGVVHVPGASGEFLRAA